MKKFLAIAMIAATLTSCGGGESTTEPTTTDSPAVEQPATTEPVTTDSPKVEAPATDSPKVEATATPEVKAEEKK